MRPGIFNWELNCPESRGSLNGGASVAAMLELLRNDHKLPDQSPARCGEEATSPHCGLGLWQTFHIGFMVRISRLSSWVLAVSP
jgi:hypothetical protein